MFKKVLVPLDGSPLAEQALAIAATFSEEIVLLQVPVGQDALTTAVTGGDLPMFVSALDDDSMAEAEQYLTNTAAKWRRANLAVETKVEVGEAAHTIVDVAAAEEVELIVMSTHGRSGVRRILFGSVTEAVLKHAPCPVLALRNERPLKRILIPLDGSFLSEEALVPALNIAHTNEAEVTLFRVQPMEIGRQDEEFAFYLRAEHGLEYTAHDVLLMNIESYLKELCEPEILAGLDMKTASRIGMPHEEILRYAAESETDLIVMSTHGRTG
ncbi:MAG: universal stress protein, partial [Anaerolineales bacterium]|nr:universal stress protein [Anaerolineales bacterium]